MKQNLLLGIIAGVVFLAGVFFLSPLGITCAETKTKVAIDLDEAKVSQDDEVTIIPLSKRRFEDMTQGNPDVVQIMDLCITPGMTLETFIQCLDESAVPNNNMRIVGDRTVYSYEDDFSKELEYYSEESFHSLFIDADDMQIYVSFLKPAEMVYKIKDGVISSIAVSGGNEGCEVRYKGYLFGNHYDNGALAFGEKNDINTMIVEQCSDLLYVSRTGIEKPLVVGITSENSAVMFQVRDLVQDKNSGLFYINNISFSFDYNYYQDEELRYYVFR